MYEVWFGLDTRPLARWSTEAIRQVIASMTIYNISEGVTVGGKRSVTIWFEDPYGQDALDERGEPTGEKESEVRFVEV